MKVGPAFEVRVHDGTALAVGVEGAARVQEYMVDFPVELPKIAGSVIRCKTA